MVEGTRGYRFYQVRLAHGDGARRPESLRRFSDRVYAATGERIHPSELSEIERDTPSKAVTADHIAAVAAVDKERRGKLWLGWGEAQDATMGVPSAEAATYLGQVKKERLERAQAERAAKRAAREAPREAKPAAQSDRRRRGNQRGGR